MKVCLAAVQAEHMGYLRHLTPWLESKGHEVREQMSSAKYGGLGEADVFVVWNGTEMVGKPDGQVLYAEVGWFPGAPTPGSAKNMYLDRKGINAASELSAFPHKFRNGGHIPDTYDTPSPPAPSEIRGRQGPLSRGDYTFVPLQMDDDSNVRLHGRGWTNQALILRCQQTVEGPLIFKRHPRDTKDYTITAGTLVTGGNIWDWILPAKRVIGINSTALLQAWAAGKDVVVYGDTFWANSRDRTWLVSELLLHRQLRWYDAPRYRDIAWDADQNRVLQEVFCET